MEEDFSERGVSSALPWVGVRAWNSDVQAWKLLKEKCFALLAQLRHCAQN
jgi:hypothetical protein